MSDDKFDPVPHNHEEMLAKEMQDPEFARIWNTPDSEMEALDAILKARKKAEICRKQITKNKMAK